MRCENQLPISRYSLKFTSHVGNPTSHVGHEPSSPLPGHCRRRATFIIHVAHLATTLPSPIEDVQRGGVTSHVGHRGSGLTPSPLEDVARPSLTSHVGSMHARMWDVQPRPTFSTREDVQCGESRPMLGLCSGASPSS
ncbi:hypothetical protein AAHE18_16G141700 [Arachis hypogaea]